MTYKEARAYIERIAGYGSILGLTPMKNLLWELRNPQQDFSCIHIAGTNGKGSILAYISTVLSEAGICTGRYISPTVQGYLERIQINGEWISEEEFAILTEKVKEAADRVVKKGGQHPTVFELETAIAFLYFQQKKCKLVVLETGLGGTLDATNVITNTLAAVFASISRDHMGVLGDTLEEIAGNKAGIIKSGCIVISGSQKAEVCDVLIQTSKELGCPYLFVDTEGIEILNADYHGQTFRMPGEQTFKISLVGPHQIENAVTAIETIHFLRQKGYEISEEALYAGLEKAVWQGRFTCIMEEPLFIVDGAHNEAAALRLRETVESCLAGKNLIYIMGVFKDKEYEKIAEIMCPLASQIYTVPLPDEVRSLLPEELQKAAEKYCSQVTACGSVAEALELACNAAGEGDAVLAFGSLSYLGQIMGGIQYVRGRIR